MAPSIYNKRFNRLTAIQHVQDSNPPKWLFMCDCGNKKEILKQNVISGNTTSCGCYRKEKRTVHGHCKNSISTKVYHTWQHMKDRCYNKNHDYYYNYGGRGIIVCDRWKYSFELFLSDVGEPPTNKHSIDRINNDGNYEPGNVRWSTMKVQSNNRRSRK